MDLVYPSAKVYSNASGEREIINVSVSQHPDWEAGMGGSAFYGNTKTGAAATTTAIRAIRAKTSSMATTFRSNGTMH